MTVLVIDNYDSFTYNLVHYLGELGAKLAVRRNDKITVDEVDGDGPRGDRAVARPLHAERGRHLPRPDPTAPAPEIPIFGVCLGHQAIGQAYGGTVVRAPTPDARQGQRPSATPAAASSAASTATSRRPATTR